jgi:hypothetical protein
MRPTKQEVAAWDFALRTTLFGTRIEPVTYCRRWGTYGTYLITQRSYELRASLGVENGGISARLSSS